MFCRGTEEDHRLPVFASVYDLQGSLDVLITEVRKNDVVVCDTAQGVNDGPNKGTRYPQAVTTVRADIVVISNERNIATFLILKSSQDLVRMVFRLQEHHSED